MLRKTLLLALAISLFHVEARKVIADSQEGAELRRVANVKAAVAKRGIGEKARIKVTLRDKTEVKGYVYQAGEDSFIVADIKTSARTTIPYSDVRQVKGKGLSTAAKIGIGVGIGVVVIVVVVVAAANSIESGFGR